MLIGRTLKVTIHDRDANPVVGFGTVVHVGAAPDRAFHPGTGSPWYGLVQLGQQIACVDLTEHEVVPEEVLAEAHTREFADAKQRERDARDAARQADETLLLVRAEVTDLSNQLEAAKARIAELEAKALTVPDQDARAAVAAQRQAAELKKNRPR